MNALFQTLDFVHGPFSDVPERKSDSPDVGRQDKLPSDMTRQDNLGETEPISPLRSGHPEQAVSRASDTNIGSRPLTMEGIDIAWMLMSPQQRRGSMATQISLDRTAPPADEASSQFVTADDLQMVNSQHNVYQQRIRDYTLMRESSNHIL